MNSSEVSARASSKKSGFRRGLAIGAGAGVGAVAVVGGTIAVASIPSGNTYSGCRNNTTKALRIIDKDLGQTCVAGETGLSWTTWKARGGWLPSTTYRNGDVVMDFGNTYVAKATVPANVRPPNGTYWVMIGNGVGNRLFVTSAGNATVPDYVSGTTPSAPKFLDTGNPAISVGTGDQVELKGSAVIGSSAAAGADISLCYMNQVDTVVHFVGSTQQVSVSGSQQGVAFFGITPALTKGTYVVGLCGDKTSGFGSFDNNGKVVTEATAS